MPTPPTRPGGVRALSAVWPLRHTRATRQRRPSLLAESDARAARRGQQAWPPKVPVSGASARGWRAVWRGRAAGGGAVAAASREIASDTARARSGGAHACVAVYTARRGRGGLRTGNPRAQKKVRVRVENLLYGFSRTQQAHALYDHGTLDARFRTTLRVSFHHRLEHEPKV